jgi:hypothetical protein
MDSGSLLGDIHARVGQPTVGLLDLAVWADDAEETGDNSSVTGVQTGCLSIENRQGIAPVGHIQELMPLTV